MRGHDDCKIGRGFPENAMALVNIDRALTVHAPHYMARMLASRR